MCSQRTQNSLDLQICTWDKSVQVSLGNVLRETKLYQGTKELSLLHKLYIK